MGSTTSRSESAKPRGETELAPPTLQTSPDPDCMEWSITSAAGRERVASALQPLVRGFIDMFCEVDPKVRSTFGELMSALSVHLDNNGVHITDINVKTAHCVATLVCGAEPGVRLTGIMTRNRPFELLALNGIRLRSFPDVEPTRTRRLVISISAYKIDVAYDAVVGMLKKGASPREKGASPL